ncbi:DUF7144 family membrane protein [Micromonospora sp. URMC 105]|uniref:DUF7144 family membrane protein n=1 Tax=Micromonospora sp. URMC 105 TaxID=3423413 RepID=UPI003F1BCFF0
MGLPASDEAIRAEQPGRPLLAAGLLTTAGLLDVLSAQADTSGDPFVVTTRQGMYAVDITGWAWLHVAVGAAVVLAGLAVVTGRRGTTPVALGCATAGVVLDLLLFPYAPIRALLVVGLYVAAGRLLLRHRRATRVAGQLSAVHRPGPSSPDPPPWSPTRPD